MTWPKYVILVLLFLSTLASASRIGKVSTKPMTSETFVGVLIMQSLFAWLVVIA